MAARQSNSLKKIIEAEKGKQEEQQVRQAAVKAARVKARVEEATSSTDAPSSSRLGEQKANSDDEYDLYKGWRDDASSIRRIYPQHDDVAKYRLSERSPEMRLNGLWHKFNVPEDKRDPEISLQLRRHFDGHNISEFVAEVADLYSLKISLPAGGEVDLNVLIPSAEARNNPDLMIPFDVVDCGQGTPAFKLDPHAWYNYLSFWEDVDGLKQELDSRLLYLAAGNQDHIGTIPLEEFQKRMNQREAELLLASQRPGNCYPYPSVEQAQLATEDQLNWKKLQQAEALRGEMEDVDEVIDRSLSRRLLEMGCPRTPKRQPSIESTEEDYLHLGARRKKPRKSFHSSASSSSSNDTIELPLGAQRIILDSLDPEGEDMRHTRAVNAALDDLFKREDEGTAFQDGVETIPLYGMGYWMDDWMKVGRYKCMSKQRLVAAEDSRSSSADSSPMSTNRSSPPILRSWSGFGSLSPRAELSGNLDSSQDLSLNRSELEAQGPSGSGQGSVVAPVATSEMMNSYHQRFMTYMSEMAKKKGLKNPDMTISSTASSRSVYSAISGLEELGLSMGEDPDDIMDHIEINQDDLEDSAEEVDLSVEADKPPRDVETQEGPGRGDQVPRDSVQGEPSQQVHPGRDEQVSRASVQGEPRQQGEKVHDVIPAGGESDYDEEADLSSLFPDNPESSFLFNDSVEVFLAKQVNESQIVTVTTSESSSASVNGPGDLMNEAIVAEDEVAPEDNFDDEDIFEDDDLPDLV